MISDDDWNEGLKILRRYKLDDINFKIYSKSKDYDNIGYVMGQILMATMDKEWCIGKTIRMYRTTPFGAVRGRYHLFLLEKSGDSMDKEWCAFKTPLIYRVVDYDKKYGWRFKEDAAHGEMLTGPMIIELYLNHNEIALLPKLRSPSFLNWVENPFEVKQ